MARLLGLQIQNFRALRSVSIGSSGAGGGSSELPALTAFIGANGAGKSTLLDVIGFLCDTLRDGVEAACDLRGGFSRVVTQGSGGPVGFTVDFDPGEGERPVHFHFRIQEHGAQVKILLELARYTVDSEEYLLQRTMSGDGSSQTLLVSPAVIDGQPGYGKNLASYHLDDPTRLAIASLGQIREHSALVSLRSYLEGWYLSYFEPRVARLLPVAGPQRHLNREGSNLGNYLQHLDRNHKERLQTALAAASRRIPGLNKIQYKVTEDGRLLLQFNEQGFQDPFYQASMSDGALKLLAYLLLLQDPDPPTLIGIEEPENGLYPRLQTVLAEELRAYAESGRTQVMLTTHSPYLVNALTPEQVFLMARGEDGGVQITRTSDIPTIRGLYESGIPMGDLWYSNHFGEWKGE